MYNSNELAIETMLEKKEAGNFVKNLSTIFKLTDRQLKLVYKIQNK